MNSIFKKRLLIDAEEIVKKHTIIYYEILNYQSENLAFLNEHFNVIRLPDPTYDASELLHQADVVLAPLGYYVGQEKIDQALNLKIIGSNTTGYPHIDIEYAAQKGIQVITLKDQHDFLKTITPTAELTWGLIIAVTRNMFSAYKSVLNGKWNRRPFGGKAMLSRMALGIAGLGRLGSVVASYGQFFGMKVKYYDPFVTADQDGVEKVDTLEALVSSSDIITIHIPHKKETENLFDKNIFAYFKKGSYLINTSRGELIDFNALLDCLKNEILSGVGLDVFENEFVPDFEGSLEKHPLLQYAQKSDNLIITPHIGGSTVDAWRETERYTLNMIKNALDKMG